jgi:hypothetical protein
MKSAFLNELPFCDDRLIEIGMPEENGTGILGRLARPARRPLPAELAFPLFFAWLS